MGIYKLLLPKMGESVSEATLTKWVKVVGDHVQEDDTIAEIATDKVDSEVPSPVNGRLKELMLEEGQIVQVGDVIALIEIEEDSTENTSSVEDETTSEETSISSEEDISIPGIAELQESQSLAPPPPP
ncbi:MAG TPA: biotin/lipoyl-binding protein, partial [Sphingobacterium sp.]|nr:biotin/lipoyl-binding protein [Sphingobacterium sp.]